MRNRLLVNVLVLVAFVALACAYVSPLFRAARFIGGGW